MLAGNIKIIISFLAMRQFIVDSLAEESCGAQGNCVLPLEEGYMEWSQLG
jgi:hypothetical protein